MLDRRRRWRASVCWGCLCSSLPNGYQGRGSPAAPPDWEQEALKEATGPIPPGTRILIDGGNHTLVLRGKYTDIRPYCQADCPSGVA
jgi:hypothetical protein